MEDGDGNAEHEAFIDDFTLIYSSTMDWIMDLLVKNIVNTWDVAEVAGEMLAWCNYQQYGLNQLASCGQ